MGQYYTIKGIKKGNEWSNSFGTFQSYSLSLEGLGEPVSLNKAVPVSHEPTPGEKIYGSVEMLMSQKGTSYYKFKGEKPPEDTPAAQNAPQGSYAAHNEDKEDSIARAVALKAAVEFCSAPDCDITYVLAAADDFLVWLKNDSGSQGRGEAVDSSPQATNEAKSPPAAATGYEKAKAIRNKLEPLPPEPEDLMDWIGQDDEN